MLIKKLNINNIRTMINEIQNTLGSRKVFLITFFSIISFNLGFSEDTVQFEQELWPIIKESCLKCHRATYTNEKGKVKKPKGGLRVDSPKNLMKGAVHKDGTIDKVIIPGKPEESSFYTLTTLAEDHDDIMPSKGDLLTIEQQKLIERWIAEGAHFGDWKGVAKD